MNEFVDFMVRGGPVMVPILALSVVALAVFLERIWVLQSAKVIPPAFYALIQRKVREGRPAEALTLCEGTPSSFATVAAAGLKRHGRPRDQIKEAFEEVGRLEVVYLTRFVEVLGTIAAIEPLLGLLGTVLGMIDVFRSIVERGTGGPVDPTLLADGIWQALITTAGGLIIAIPAYVGYKYLLSRVDRLAIEMEEGSLELLDLLTNEAPAATPAEPSA